jgi:hypothetical protein
MHDFDASLAMSHAASDLPLWEQVYRRAFHDFACMVDHRQSGEHQLAGIDRSVILSNSKQVLVDEKVRGRNKKTGEVYDDITLEYWSNWEQRVRGWVCKPLRADYIAYAIAPLGRCYLLPVLQLRSAWRQCHAVWCKRYPCVMAENPRYTTVCVAVPPEVVLQSIRQALVAEFDPFELDEQKGPAP